MIYIVVSIYGTLQLDSSIIVKSGCDMLQGGMFIVGVFRMMFIFASIDFARNTPSVSYRYINNTIISISIILLLIFKLYLNLIYLTLSHKCNNFYDTYGNILLILAIYDICETSVIFILGYIKMTCIMIDISYDDRQLIIDNNHYAYTI